MWGGGAFCSFDCFLFFFALSEAGNEGWNEWDGGGVTWVGSFYPFPCATAEKAASGWWLAGCCWDFLPEFLPEGKKRWGSPLFVTCDRQGAPNL